MPAQEHHSLLRDYLHSRLFLRPGHPENVDLGRPSWPTLHGTTAGVALRGGAYQKAKGADIKLSISKVNRQQALNVPAESPAIYSALESLILINADLPGAGQTNLQKAANSRSFRLLADRRTTTGYLDLGLR